MPYDIEAARQAGATDEQIKGYLGQHIDVDGALQAGASLEQISGYVGGSPHTPAQQPQPNVSGSQMFANQATSEAIPGTPILGQALHTAANFANAAYNLPVDLATSIFPKQAAAVSGYMSAVNKQPTQSVPYAPLPGMTGDIKPDFSALQPQQTFQQAHPYINQAIQDAFSVLPMAGEVMGSAGKAMGEVGKASYGQDLGITKSLGNKAGNGLPFVGKERILNTIQDNNLGSMTMSKSFDKTTDLIGQKAQEYQDRLNSLPPDPKTGIPGAYRTVIPSQIATLSEDDITKMFPAGEREQARAAMDKITGEIKNYNKPTLLKDFDDIKDDLAPVYNKGTLLSTPDAVANTVRKALTYKVLDYFEQNVDPSLRGLGRDMKDLYDVKEAYSNAVGKNKTISKDRR